MESFHWLHLHLPEGHISTSLSQSHRGLTPSVWDLMNTGMRLSTRKDQPDRLCNWVNVRSRGAKCYLPRYLGTYCQVYVQYKYNTWLHYLWHGPALRPLLPRQERRPTVLLSRPVSWFDLENSISVCMWFSRSVPPSKQGHPQQSSQSRPHLISDMQAYVTT